MFTLNSWYEIPGDDSQYDVTRYQYALHDDAVIKAKAGGRTLTEVRDGITHYVSEPTIKFTDDMPFVRSVAVIR